MKQFHNGKFLFGTTKIGERGQIVIPKEAREKFNFKPGDTLIVLGDEKKNGIAIVKADLFKKLAIDILEGIGYLENNERDWEESEDSKESTEPTPSAESSKHEKD